MSTKTFILTSSGLKNLVSGVEQEKEFEFIFGQQKVSMKNVFAEFISPSVSKLHQTDPTTNCICFNDKLKDIVLSENSISKFNSISKGETVTISEEESFEMILISILVDNEEFFNKLNDLYSNKINEANIDHYLSNLTLFSQISPLSKYFDYNNIVDTISSHFYSIDKNKLKRLPNPILYSIISNSNLRLESEDSLLDFLNEFFDKEYSETSICFYEEVEYSMLSENKFEEFIDDFDSSKMTHELWMKLKQCFYSNESQRINKLNENRYTSKENITSPNTYGIIDYLTKEVGGNADDKGVVKATASSVYLSYYAKCALDIHDKSNYFHSGASSSSWLKYDFIKKRVHPIAYSITTRPYNGYQPRNWVIEGSNNDINWTVLDSRQNDSSLEGPNVTCTFDINQHDKNFRYLRIRQTGKDSSNNDFLTFSSLEFFGNLSED